MPPATNRPAICNHPSRAPKILATMSEPDATFRRCRWATREPSLSYHDIEWGVPVHDDRTWFEFITLEGAQAGLSWETVLKSATATAKSSPILIRKKSPATTPRKRNLF